MIVSKFFESDLDFINVVCVCKKFSELIDMFHYNPIPVKLINIYNVFHKIDTQYLYSPNDVPLRYVKNLFYYYKVDYTDYLKKNGKNVKFNCVYLSRSDSMGTHLQKFPEVVTRLGDQCFFGIKSSLIKKELVIPSQIKSFGVSTFASCSMVSISFSTQIHVIPDCCFSSCFALKSIDLSHIQSIGDRAFADCQSLTSVTISTSLKNIAPTAFLNQHLHFIKVCDGDTMNCVMPYTISELITNARCLHIEYTSFDKKGRKTEPQKIIPTGVHSIGFSCFSNDKWLTKVIIPTTVTSLGSLCFFNCVGLKEIVIPTTITSFGERCFKNCKNLEQNKQIPRRCFNAI
ncbi:Leucine rich repeat containing protein BspA family protein [Entamoeba marina]